MLGAIYKNYISGDCPNYVAVQVTGDDAKVNGKRLIEAYARAKTLTPNGAALSATNRACVILPPGKYDLDHGAENACVPLTLDTEFVDIIGLTTDRSLQHIYGTPPATNSGVIVQTADDVHISNLTVEILTEVEIVEEAPQYNYDNTVSSAYFPSTNLSNAVLDNCYFIGYESESLLLWSMRLTIEYSGTFNYCTGGYGSFGGEGIASGTFTNCTGVDGSFGGSEEGTDGTASGTFTNCTGGDCAFGTYGTASGTFTNCTGGFSSFGGKGIASGTFNYCTGGDKAFGGSGTASGTFTNCTGGDKAFGYSGTASGTFTNCTGGDYAFGYSGTASGTFTNCTGGAGSFGAYGIASGTFNYCTGGAGSFGAYGIASGTFNYCTGGYGSFGGVGIVSGTFTNCTGGDNSFGAYGIVSGTFTNCTGGDNSFGGGGGGIVSGTFTFCKGGEDSFRDQKPTASAATIELVAGGTGYTAYDELTVEGGTGTAARIKVLTVNAGVILTAELLTAGSYTLKPSNAGAITGGTGNNDATFNLTWNEGHMYGCVDDTGFIAELNWDD